MIRANRTGLLAAMWRRYVDFKLRRTFRAVWLRGALPRGDAARNLLLYANHSSFWDGFALHALAQAGGWNVRCAMEEKNLARWPFLARLGAFSIRRGDARSALQSLRYAKHELIHEGATVCVFPEGVLTAPSTPPLRLERGVEVLARMAGSSCISLGIRCVFFEDEKPDLLLELGPVHSPSSLREFGQALDARVHSVNGATSVEGFTPLLRGSSGVATRWALPTPKAGDVRG